MQVRRPRYFAAGGVVILYVSIIKSYEDCYSRCGRYGQSSCQDAQRQRPRYNRCRSRREGADRGGQSGGRHNRRGRYHVVQRTAQGRRAQVRPVHRRAPRRERQHTLGRHGQAAGCEEVHSPRRQQRVSRTQQQGSLHKHGHRLPVLPRADSRTRGDKPAGTLVDDRVRRLFGRQALARGIPFGTYLAAIGTRGSRLCGRRGRAGIPHGGDRQGQCDDHPVGGRRLRGGRHGICHFAPQRHRRSDGAVRDAAAWRSET